MGKWLERKPNWLKDLNSAEQNIQREKPFGRPSNDSGDYGVHFIPLKCPKCRSKNVRCYSSHPPIRYHICNKCGHNFKSLEVETDK